MFFCKTTMNDHSEANSKNVCSYLDIFIWEYHETFLVTKNFGQVFFKYSKQHVNKTNFIKN